jgi:Fic family protein
MRRTYIWEHPAWPKLTYDPERLVEPLSRACFSQGEIQGAARNLGFDERQNIEVDVRTEDAVETSAIEGAAVSRPSVRSSVARRLGAAGAGAAADPYAEGVTAMILDATRNHADDLTLGRLFSWHAGLFPTALGVDLRVRAGDLRNDESGPMQVVSGRVDAPTVHYEAPPAGRIREETERFIKWFNAAQALDGLVFAGIAHLWFVTLHPFDDGNGRIARAIADMALSRDERSPFRYVSMTAQIAREKNAYYDHLEHAQRGDLNVTDWLIWFLECYRRATQKSLETIAKVLARSKFWSHAHEAEITARHKHVLERFLEDDWQGFLTAPKYAKLANVSADTAQRDIAELAKKQLIVRNPGGSKKTSYALRAFDDWAPSHRDSVAFEPGDEVGWA